MSDQSGFGNGELDEEEYDLDDFEVYVPPPMEKLPQVTPPDSVAGRPPAKNHVYGDTTFNRNMIHDHDFGNRTDGATEPDTSVLVYPYVHSPRPVLRENWFPLTIGIDPQAMDDLQIEPLDVPDQFKLTMWIIAPDFDLDIDSARVDVDVDLTATDPAEAFPKKEVLLRARPAAPDTADVSIVFFANRQPLGVVTRTLRISNPVDSQEEPVPEPDDVFELAPAEPGRELDLTLWIRRTSMESSVYSCVVVPAHEGFEPVMHEFTLGPNPESWLKLTMAKLDAQRGQSTARNALLSVARTVGAKLPDALPELVLRMRDELNRPPRVLILTDDLVAPWELAAIESNETNEIAVLGSVATVGRWTTKRRGEAVGRSGAPMSEDLNIADIRAVAGDYVKPLKHSKMEQEHLATTFAATRVAATLPEIEVCLNEDAGWDLLHLAIHLSLIHI